MNTYLPKRTMRLNADRIVELADTFGRLHYNRHGQTVEGTLNLSIPTARIVKARIVDRVFDTNDGVNDSAVADVEQLCREAVAFNTTEHGRSWWSARADELLPEQAGRLS